MTKPSSYCVMYIREFKIYDATVYGSASLKIASSSLSIFFAIISVCVTFESYQDYSGTEFRGAVSRLRKKIPICACVFTFSSRRRFVENGKEMYRNNNST